MCFIWINSTKLIFNIFWTNLFCLCFQEEDIRLYSCLANGSADEFIKGEHMLKIKAVKEPLQIGT